MTYVIENNIPLPPKCKGKFPGRKFACRKHEGGLRVWRTE